MIASFAYTYKKKRGAPRDSSDESLLVVNIHEVQDIIVSVHQESDEEGLLAYLMEKVAHTGNYEALVDAARDWLVARCDLTSTR